MRVGPRPSVVPRMIVSIEARNELARRSDAGRNGGGMLTEAAIRSLERGARETAEGNAVHQLDYR